MSPLLLLTSTRLVLLLLLVAAVWLLLAFLSSSLFCFVFFETHPNTLTYMTRTLNTHTHSTTQLCAAVEPNCFRYFSDNETIHTGHTHSPMCITINSSSPRRRHRLCLSFESLRSFLFIFRINEKWIFIFFRFFLGFQREAMAATAARTLFII